MSDIGKPGGGESLNVTGFYRGGGPSGFCGHFLSKDDADPTCCPPLSHDSTVQRQGRLCPAMDQDESSEEPDMRDMARLFGQTSGRRASYTRDTSASVFFFRSCRWHICGSLSSVSSREQSRGIHYRRELLRGS